MCHQKEPTFFWLAFTIRPPFLKTFTQWPPSFWKFRHFWQNVEKFLAILALNALIFDAFHWKNPYFCALCHSKTPVFDAICHRKAPTSEVYSGTRTSLSYVSSPPPGFLTNFSIFLATREHSFNTSSGNTYLILSRILLTLLTFLFYQFCKEYEYIMFLFGVDSYLGAILEQSINNKRVKNVYY